VISASHPDGRAQSGFTLIEVLVALLVFGLIATAASQVSSQYITIYERVGDRTLAGWIADNEMARLRLDDAMPDVDEDSEDQTFGADRWRVTTEVLTTEEPSIRRVEISVARYRDGAREPARVHTLSGFIGDRG